jgi:hypothetical protein
MHAALAALTPYGEGDQKVLITKQSALINNTFAGDVRAIGMIMAFCLRTSEDDAQGEEAEAPEDREIMRAVSAHPAKRRCKPSSTDKSSNEKDQ